MSPKKAKAISSKALHQSFSIGRKKRERDIYIYTGEDDIERRNSTNGARCRIASSAAAPWIDSQSQNARQQEGDTICVSMQDSVLDEIVQI